LSAAGVVTRADSPASSSDFLFLPAANPDDIPSQKREDKRRKQ